MYMGEESSSLLGFLEWLAVPSGVVSVGFCFGYYVYVLYALWLYASFNIFALTYQKKIFFFHF